MALRTPLTAQPHLYIGDSTGRPLDYGRVYFGEPNKDPEFYPIDIYLDPEMTIAAAQPVRTKGGFMDVGGDLAELHAAEVIYSLKVLDQYGRQVFYKPEMYRNNVSDFLVDEITRATAAETLIAGNLTAETQRAVAAEKVIADAVVAEKDRAIAAEDALDIKHAALSSTINSLGGGKKAYTTYALMVADKDNIAANSSIDVTNDTDPLKNGTYSYDGAVFAKSIYDVETIVRAKVLNTFKTKALMDVSALPDGADAQVTNDAGNNGLYVRTAGAWVKSAYDPVTTSVAYTNSALGQYFAKSVSLFDPAAAELGYSISESGEKIATSGYAVSEMIAVEAATVYTMAREAHSQNIAFISIAFYDASKNFLVRNTYTAMPTGYQQVTTPANARFAILNINAGLPSEGNRMFYKGTEQLSYVPYSLPSLKNVTLSDEVVVGLADEFLSTDYVSSSYNLFNPKLATASKVVTETGVIDTNASYSISDFIAIEPSEQYTLSHIVHSQALPFAHTAYYDENKQFIERVGVVGDAASANIVITVPSNPAIAYARFNMNAGGADEYNRMIIKGSVAKPYMPYSNAKLEKLELGEVALNQVNEAQEINKHLLPSKNLFNPATATIGKVVSITGVITDNAMYSISDFITVDANSQYTISGTKDKNAFIHTAYYTADKTFISRINSFTDDTPDGYLHITTPANAAYVRFNINDGTAYEKERMFVKGAVVAPTYQPYGQTLLTGLKLADDVVAGLDIPSGGGTAGEVYWYSRPMNEVFNTDKVWTQYSAWNDIESDAVYQMFDDLMAEYPDYITKKVLGTDPVDGSTIAAYYFNPATQPSPVATKRPKVFSVCGIHGMEHVPPLTHYLMLKGMCEDWKTDPMLEALRFNVEWIIIPVANPWGFDRFTRLNGQSVDLNRNFPADWAYVDPATDPGHYAGEVAGSEPETQYIMQIIDENPDLDIVFDCHSFNGDINHHHITWLHLTGKNPNDAKQHQMFQALGRRLDAKWRKDFTWFPPTTTYPLTRNTQGTTGQVQNYANLKGVIYPACFEVGARWWDKAGSAPFTDYHVKSVVEVTVNWYLMLLNSLGK